AKIFPCSLSLIERVDSSRGEPSRIVQLQYSTSFSLKRTAEDTSAEKIESSGRLIRNSMRPDPVSFLLSSSLKNRLSEVSINPQRPVDISTHSDALNSWHPAKFAGTNR